MGERRRQNSRLRALARRVPVALGVAAVALSAAGCGEEEEGAAAVPVPADCLQSWNSEQTSVAFGRHVYETHDTRQAQVAMLEPAGKSLIVRGRTCAVIFAVPESDFEYGDVGLVVTELGWASMRELARDDQIELERIQAEATASPNATLFPDGRLEAD